MESGKALKVHVTKVFMKLESAVLLGGEVASGGLRRKNIAASVKGTGDVWSAVDGISIHFVIR